MSDAPNSHTEARGGAAPEGEEFAEKGGAADVAAAGIVPTELGGPDANPELPGDVSGGYAKDPDVTATEGGVDLSAGDNADATSMGGAPSPADIPDASAVQTRPDADAV
ncbi:MAG: hypothetical protein QOH12_1801 [Solirubrobacteraceae bacterium]|jgi:hypothetical protein|nr:hypothetical protein [Solirubrobacteraceae bacterium]